MAMSYIWDLPYKLWAHNATKRSFSITIIKSWTCLTLHMFVVVTALLTTGEWFVVRRLPPLVSLESLS